VLINNKTVAAAIGNRLIKLGTFLKTPANLTIVDKAEIAGDDVEGSFVFLTMIGFNEKQFPMMLMIRKAASESDFFEPVVIP
jgi:hypothetical protein